MNDIMNDIINNIESLSDNDLYDLYATIPIEIERRLKAKVEAIDNRAKGWTKVRGEPRLINKGGFHVVHTLQKGIFRLKCKIYFCGREIYELYTTALALDKCNTLDEAITLSEKIEKWNTAIPKMIYDVTGVTVSFMHDLAWNGPINDECDLSASYYGGIWHYRLGTTKWVTSGDIVPKYIKASGIVSVDSNMNISSDLLDSNQACWLALAKEHPSTGDHNSLPGIVHTEGSKYVFTIVYSPTYDTLMKSDISIVLDDEQVKSFKRTSKQYAKDNI